jgi:hypothetical protein
MPPRSENALYHGRAPRAQRRRTWSCSTRRAASDPLKGPRCHRFIDRHVYDSDRLGLQPNVGIASGQD